jgi:CRP-like cAMP-binding protein
MAGEALADSESVQGASPPEKGGERKPIELLGGRELSEEVQQRMSVVQELLSYQGSKEYGLKQREISERLGISVRGLQRLLRAWREQGLLGLSRRE